MLTLTYTLPSHPHLTTQVVWKGTTSVGCSLARCSFGTLVVCHYSPQGNILGQFAANV